MLYEVITDYTATVTATNSLSTITATTQVTILALLLDAGPDQSADEGDATDGVLRDLHGVDGLGESGG